MRWNSRGCCAPAISPPSTSRRGRMRRSATCAAPAMPRGRYLATVVCPTPAQPIVFQDSGSAVDEQVDRLQCIEAERQALAPPWHRSPVVQALQALRRVHWVVALTVVAELGDLTRVDHPRQRAAVVGLVPSEYSSGTRAARVGSRRPATGGRVGSWSAAWASRHPAQVSAHIQQRIDQLPTALPDLGWKAHGERRARIVDCLREHGQRGISRPRSVPRPGCRGVQAWRRRDAPGSESPIDAERAAGAAPDIRRLPWRGSTRRTPADATGMTRRSTDFRRLLETLVAGGVEFIVIGGVAATLRGSESTARR
jgi:hypothetical protein